MNTAIYWCTERRCRGYHHELEAAPPLEIRQATGRGAACPICGRGLRLVRMILAGRVELPR